MAAVDLILPWPPSVNAYWRSIRRRVVLSIAARRYHAAVAERVQLARERLELGSPLLGRLAVRIEARPADGRVRDLDNLAKATLDAMAKAGVYEDDGQIDRLVIERGPVGEGVLMVTVAEMEAG